MTVATATNRVSYAGDGSQTAFPVTFYFLENSHIRAILRTSAGAEVEWAETTNYTLTGAGDDDGGTLTALVAPATGETLVIVRDVPATQEADYVDNDSLPAETLETSFDKLTMIAQQLSEQQNRVISVPVTDSGGVELPTSVERANRYLAFDSNGTPIASTDPGLIVVSPYAEELLDSADAEAFLEGLGATTVGAALFTATDAAAGRTALELGSAATADTGTEAGDVPDTDDLAHFMRPFPTLSNSTTSPNSVIDVSTGAAPADDYTTVIVATSAGTIDFGATGADGLDTGSIAADKTYHCFLIRKSADGTVARLGSLNATAPTMPTGYDQKGRVGAVRTDGSGNIRPFIQDDDLFQYSEPSSEDVEVTASETASMADLPVPTGLRIEAILGAFVFKSGATPSVYISDPSTDDLPASSARATLRQDNSAAGGVMGGIRVMTNTFGQVRVVASEASTPVSLSVHGWIDRRGKT